MDLSDFLAVRSGVSIVDLLRKLSERRKKKLDDDDIREIARLALFNTTTTLVIIQILVLQEQTNSRRELVLDAIQELHASATQVILDSPEFQDLFSSKKEIEEFKTALPDIFTEWKKDLNLESD